MDLKLVARGEPLNEWVRHQEAEKEKEDLRIINECSMIIQGSKKSKVLDSPIKHLWMLMSCNKPNHDLVNQDLRKVFQA